jgi:antitoxin (DNA-binding transcriptional repressor) of toxin-antitoxin stability system
MAKVNIHEAKSQLSEHLDRLERGEIDVLVICRRNQPIAELRALAKKRTTPRPIFAPDKRFALSPRFFEALPEDVLESFEDRGG